MTESRLILGCRIDNLTYGSAIERIVDEANRRGSGYVCPANVHVIMEAFDNLNMREAVNSAFMVTPDGMPLVWALRLLGIKNAERVYGPTLTKEICTKAARLGIPVGFYGSSQEVLNKMISNLHEACPQLKICFRYSPPYRSLTLEEDHKLVGEINDSGAKLLFVGLGCPKQEMWMLEHKDRIKAVMLGVGAAFDFIAGSKRQAPAWLQRLGLEWLFRLLTEPKRLWRRYLYHNPRFIYHFVRQILFKSPSPDGL